VKKYKIGLGLTFIIFANLVLASILPKFQGAGLDYVFNAPEMFFHDTDTLTVGVEYEILNCFGWDDRDRPVNECVKMEFVASNNSTDADGALSAPIDYDRQCSDGRCETSLKLPLLTLLTASEYEMYAQGKIVKKKIILRLSYRVDKNAKEFAKAFYELSYALNQNGAETVEIDSFVRSSVFFQNIKSGVGQ